MSLKIRSRVISVDRGMASTVAWLNSFYGIFTHWSCEGDPNPPYVTFSCINDRDLHKMLTQLHCETPEGDLMKHSVCEVLPFDGKIRYTIKWSNVATFKLWKREGPLKEVA